MRVPRAWGVGGEAMEEAARASLPYPEVAVVEESTLTEQTLAVAAALPERPLVVGGCCSAHVGAVEGLAARNGPLAVVWFDAHGDLNTPETSPSGNLWGMPLRMLLDSATIRAEDTALVGARNLDPPEQEFIERSGLQVGEGAVERAAAEVGCVYVALDGDALDAAEVSSFVPEPGGLSVAEAEVLLGELARRRTIIGAGVSGLVPDARNVEPITRLLGALGL